MSITSAQDLITKAMQKIGAVAANETPANAELSDGLDSLNLMLESWAGRSLLTVATVRENFTLTANTANYAIGANQACNTTKPFSIIGGFIRDGNNDDSPLEIYSKDQYNAIGSKNDTGRPAGLMYDPGATQQANQAGTIYYYPTPDNSTTYTAYLELEKPFTSVANLTDTITFPPGYKRAIVYNLALEIGMEYGLEVSPSVLKIAEESLKIIENINSRNKKVVAAMDLPAAQTAYNIFGGE